MRAGLPSLDVSSGPESEKPQLIADPTRIRKLMVDLPDINMVGIGDWSAFLRIRITT